MNEEEIINLVKEIQDKMFQNEDCEELISKLQENVLYPSVAELFETDHSSQYIGKRLFHYKPTKAGDLSREDLINLVDRIIKCEGEEYELDNMIDMLEEAVIDPNITDYIYWNDTDLTPEEIVDKALAYKPI